MDEHFTQEPFEREQLRRAPSACRQLLHHPGLRLGVATSQSPASDARSFGFGATPLVRVAMVAAPHRPLTMMAIRPVPHGAEAAAAPGTHRRMRWRPRKPNPSPVTVETQIPAV